MLKLINNFPPLPGVYLMKDADGTVIYVGKAKNLKKRVRSYFATPKDSRPNVRILVQKVRDIEFNVTSTEKEALILENTLIKKHRPRYNIFLKDDKTYASIKITVKQKFPRILLTRYIKKDGSAYFGPYSSSGAVKETIALLRDIFRLRTCTDSYLKNRSRACLNYQIKKCGGPCVKYINAAEYKKSVEGVMMFLNGDVSALIRKLKKEMKETSEALEFEQAARLRDQISAVKLTVEKQRAVMHKKGTDSDIIGLHRDGDNVAVNVINIRGGSITSIKSHVFLSNNLADDEVIASFIKQFYHGDIEIPREILLDRNIDEAHVIAEWLTEKREKKVSVKTPQRGEMLRLVEMSVENAKQTLINRLKLRDDADRKLSIIKEKLHLQNIPRVIECYDISNIMGTLAVGSKVTMTDGALDKDNYRRYKIKTVTGSDDYGMMSEVLKRRFKRLPEGTPRPDLLLIDGGKGHLGIALKVVAELGITGIDIVSLAKEKHKKSGATEERVYLPGRKNPVVISGQSAAMYASATNLLIQLRDEAHRFAITYHKKLRSADAVTSLFDGIKGIGPKKRELILRNIESYDDITEEKLKSIKGLNEADVANILSAIKM